MLYKFSRDILSSGYFTGKLFCTVNTVTLNTIEQKVKNIIIALNGQEGNEVDLVAQMGL